MFELNRFWKIYYKCILLAGVIQTFYAAQGYALEVQRIHLNGFLRAGTAISDSNTKYIERINSRWDWGDTHMGLNFQTNISPNWDAAGQIFGSEAEEHFNLKTDWVFGRYHDPSDHWIFKIGKVKYPNNLVSEYYDIGTVYPWIRPPQEFYSSSPTRGIKLTNEALVGAIGEYTRQLKNIGYSIQLFSGESEVEGGEYNSIVGAVTKLESEYLLLLASYQHSHADFPGEEFDDHAISSWNLGIWIDYNNVVVYSEYGRSNLTHDENIEADLHAGEKEDGKAGYITLGYRIGSILPYATYAIMEMDNKSKQESVSAGLKINLNSELTAKIQWEQIRAEEGEEEGEAGLFEELPDENKVNIASFAFDFVF